MIGSGWRTSEGQAALLALIGAVAAIVGKLDVVVQVAIVVGATVVLLALIVSRTKVKTTAAPAAGRARRAVGDQ